MNFEDIPESGIGSRLKRNAPKQFHDVSDVPSVVRMPRTFLADCRPRNALNLRE